MSSVPDCQLVLARTTLGDQLGDGFAMVDDGSWPTIEIFDGDLVVFDAEVLINRGQKIAGTVPMGDGVLTELIGVGDVYLAIFCLNDRGIAIFTLRTFKRKHWFPNFSVGRLF